MTRNEEVQDLLRNSDRSDDETAGNDQLNDAVEAAVMKIVNGTFDTGNVENKKKRKHSSDDVEDDYEFAQWTGFLDDKFINENPLIEQEEDDYEEEERTSKRKRKSDKSEKKKKKKKKKDKKRHESNGDKSINTKVGEQIQDPLIQLVTKDVEELVAEANEQPELDEDDNDNDDDDVHEPTDPVSDTESSVTPETLTTTTTTTIDTKATTKQTATKKPRKRHEPKEQFELAQVDFSGVRNEDALVNEVSRKTNAWYEENVTPEERNKPRPFSAFEDGQMAYYFGGYCHLHDMTRDDLCARVWSAERKADHFWRKVFQIFPYRSTSSIYKHVRRKFHIFDVRAIWTPEEDKKLDELALLYSNKWTQVGEVLGRMPEDCRDRWRNYVKCGNKRTMQKWSQEEEDQLIRIVTEFMTQLTNSQVVDTENQLKNINWTIVSEKMNGKRSRIQCRYKWKRIANDEVKNRVSKMSGTTIDWLLRKIKSIGYRSVNGIDWDGLTQHYFIDHNEEEIAQDPYKWGSFDFKEIVEQICQQHKDLNFGKMIDMLTNGVSFPQQEEYSLLRDSSK